MLRPRRLRGPGFQWRRAADDGPVRGCGGRQARRHDRAFGDNQARIDGHGNTVLLQDIPLYDRGSYTVFPQADGGYVVQSRNRSDAVLFKVDASPQRHGASVPSQGAVMGGDVLYDPSPIISHTVFTSTGTLYDARTKRRSDEIGVAAVDRKSRLITSYGGPARPARVRVYSRGAIRASSTSRSARSRGRSSPRPDAHNRQRAQVLQDALKSGTVRVTMKALPETRPMGPIARYTITFRDLTGVNTTVTARLSIVSTDDPGPSENRRPVPDPRVLA